MVLSVKCSICHCEMKLVGEAIFDGHGRFICPQCHQEKSLKAKILRMVFPKRRREIKWAE